MDDCDPTMDLPFKDNLYEVCSLAVVNSSGPDVDTNSFSDVD